jgi:hypothetical protein
MPDGINIGLKGRIAFYTKTAYNYYTAGNKETSADYRSKTVLVDNPEEVGYDLLMTEIVSVNNVAITQRGRGGKDVRVQDTAPVGKVIDNILSRRNNMGILAKLLGVNDQQEKSFSAVVKDSLSRFKGLTGEAQEKEIMGVVDRVSELTASPEREILANVVRDAFIHSDVVLAKWKESEGLIDGLYARCLDADAAVVAGIKDADDKKKEKDDDTKDADDKKKEKDGDTKDADKKVQDTATLIDEKLGAFAGKLPGMITEGIKKALGEGGAAETGAAVGGVQDSVTESDIDFTSYVENAFGRVGK